MCLDPEAMPASWRMSPAPGLNKTATWGRGEEPSSAGRLHVVVAIRDAGGSAFVARPEPGDVAGGRADGVVLRLEPGVLAEPGDVKSGAWPAGAGREAQLGLGHGLADRCDHLCVRGHPPG